MFTPYPYLELPGEDELPPTDYGQRLFGNDQVEAAFRDWYDRIADDDLDVDEVATEVLQVMDAARLLDTSKVHLPCDHRFYNQDAAGDAAFFFYAETACDARKIEYHLVDGDGYISVMALLIRLRDHPSAEAYRDDPEQYAKWVGRNTRGAYRDHAQLFIGLCEHLAKGNHRLVELVTIALDHASKFPGFYPELIRKLGHSAAIRPWEMVVDVGLTKLHFLLRTTEKG